MELDDAMRRTPTQEGSETIQLGGALDMSDDHTTRERRLPPAKIYANSWVGRSSLSARGGERDYHHHHFQRTGRAA